MSIDNDTKQQIIAEYATHEGDTGSPEVQVALLSHRISHLTEHLKTHKHDHHRAAGCCCWSVVVVGCSTTSPTPTSSATAP